MLTPAVWTIPALSSGIMQLAPDGTGQIPANLPCLIVGMVLPVVVAITWARRGSYRPS
ncbi:hypothetical protein KGQ19_41755 [Catenulispora sp. NL8]|uniref:Ig-like domain-containing protein n=2 Tax=Catenulispora pinistramenti TaxID=2705254 RepID=A0ABS5L4W9_9ACTN|nr:hypothetical protein [Catenulispora pinistramenti]MBS2553400.1 hypothetical protein [Catenulispora pinistramenti]